MNFHRPIRAATTGHPEWSISESPFDYQVMIYGGRNPRNGFEWLPLVFQFFGKHYSRQQLEQRAADLAEYHKREHFIIREPTDRKFMRDDRVRAERLWREG